MIIIGICDDEAYYREEITELLNSYLTNLQMNYEIKQYRSSEELMEKADNLTFLYLDIEMGAMSGIELKEHLRDVKIVFVTSHSEAVIEAFGRNVYGFLNKPIDGERFKKYLDRMIMDLEDEILYHFQGLDGLKSVKRKEILYIHAESKYSRIKTTKEEIFCNESLKILEKDLPPKSFFRCHKSYIVNFMNINRIQESIELVNRETIPIARRKKEEIKKAFWEYSWRKAR